MESYLYTLFVGISLLTFATYIKTHKDIFKKKVYMYKIYKAKLEKILKKSNTLE